MSAPPPPAPRAPTPPLLRLPFLYPLAGVVHVLLHPALLVNVLLSALQMMVLPWYLLSHTLRARVAARVATRALADARGGAPPAPLSDSERARLTVLAGPPHASPPTRGRAAVVRDSPVRGALLFLFTPGGPGPFYLRWAKNMVVAPLTAAFPAGRALAMMTDPADAALDALAPYLAAKGVRPGPERAALARAHAWRLRSFGVVAALLSVVPLVSNVTALTTAVGAALMARDLESAGLVPQAG